MFLINIIFNLNMSQVFCFFLYYIFQYLWPAYCQLHSQGIQNTFQLGIHIEHTRGILSFQLSLMKAMHNVNTSGPRVDPLGNVLNWISIVLYSNEENVVPCYPMCLRNYGIPRLQLNMVHILQNGMLDV